MGRLTKSEADSDEKLRRLSADQDKQHKQQLDAVQKRLAEALKANVEMKNELEGVKGKLEKSTSDNGALQRRIKADTDSHAKEKAEFVRRLTDAEGSLTLEKGKSLSLGKALKVQKHINSTRIEHDAEIVNTKKSYTEAMKAKKVFEINSVEEVEKVNDAVELVEGGQIAAGGKILCEVVENVIEKEKRKKNEKRARLRDNKRRKRTGFNSSALLDEGDVEEVPLELQTL